MSRSRVRASPRTRASTGRASSANGVRRGLRRRVVGVAAAGAVLTGLAVAPATADTAPTVFTVSSVQALETVAPTLSAGDTVEIAPGTYNVGSWRPELVDFGHHAVGTAAAPITITAQDPTHEPLLLGAFKFDGLQNWTFSNLRFQGTVGGQPTLTFNGGTGWALRNSEVFGASSTQALANIAIASLPAFGVPTQWTIANNAIHGGGTLTSKAGMMHEVYITAVGNAGGSQIARNVFYSTPEGAAVKIGNGGLVNSPGISDVQVVNNTMYGNFEQVLMHGQVSNNLIQGNLMVLSTRAMGDGTTVGVYLAGVTGRWNVIRLNYFFQVSRPIYNNTSTGSFVNGGGNLTGANPAFDRTATGYFHPQASAATRYGAYA